MARTIKVTNPVNESFFAIVKHIEYYDNGHHEKFKFTVDTSDGIKYIKGYVNQLSKFEVNKVSYKDLIKVENVYNFDVEYRIADVTTYSKDDRVDYHKDTNMYLNGLLPVGNDNADLINASNAANIMRLDGKDKVMFILAFLGKTHIEY